MTINLTKTINNKSKLKTEKENVILVFTVGFHQIISILTLIH